MAKPKITAKQEGGNDGYCYVVRINGREFVKGLTRREVPHYKARALAQYDLNPTKWGGSIPGLTQTAINEALDQAMDNWHNMRSMTAMQIALDMCEYNSDFENIKPAHIAPLAQVWLDAEAAKDESKKQLRDEVIRFLKEQGCTCFNQLSNGVVFTTPNSLEGLVVAYSDGSVFESIDGEDHGHKTFDDFKAAWK